jgi:hypothetical protein
MSAISSGIPQRQRHKVSFNSKVDEGLRIQQLSGGQKSLVALALGTHSLRGYVA